MRIDLLIKSLFFVLSLSLGYLLAEQNNFPPLYGIAAGTGFFFLFMGIEYLVRKITLREWNTALAGLFCGFLFGQALWLVLISVAPQISPLIHAALLLGASYVGMSAARRSSEEFYFSIPFVRVEPRAEKKRNVLIDTAALLDPRLIDLLATGLVDNAALIARFQIRVLQKKAEDGSEDERYKAKKGLDTLKKIEEIPGLALRITDYEPTKINNEKEKLLCTTRYLNAALLTSEIDKIQQAAIEDVKIVNLHALSNVLKPLTQSGELIKIKVQRYGKEENQGIGYLDDGTMVVINGGADYIGEVIQAIVLSVKHTGSGRIIFCNADEEVSCQPAKKLTHTISDLEKFRPSYHGS